MNIKQEKNDAIKRQQPLEKMLGLVYTLFYKQLGYKKLRLKTPKNYETLKRNWARLKSESTERESPNHSLEAGFWLLFHSKLEKETP